MLDTQHMACLRQGRHLRDIAEAKRRLIDTKDRRAAFFFVRGSDRRAAEAMTCPRYPSLTIVEARGRRMIDAHEAASLIWLAHRARTAWAGLGMTEEGIRYLWDRAIDMVAKMNTARPRPGVINLEACIRALVDRICSIQELGEACLLSDRGPIPAIRQVTLPTGNTTHE